VRFLLLLVLLVLLLVVVLLLVLLVLLLPPPPLLLLLLLLAGYNTNTELRCCDRGRTHAGCNRPRLCEAGEPWSAARVRVSLRPRLGQLSHRIRGV
jgi:energy-coupling factor transporter transmembrane protein EcfT